MKMLLWWGASYCMQMERFSMLGLPFLEHFSRRIMFIPVSQVTRLL